MTVTFAECTAVQTSEMPACLHDMKSMSDTAYPALQINAYFCGVPIVGDVVRWLCTPDAVATTGTGTSAGDVRESDSCLGDSSRGDDDVD